MSDEAAALGFIEDREPLPLTDQIRSELLKTASMRRGSGFARRFDVLAARNCRDAWWLDLLRLWRPAGVPAGERGLRLAVREEYLNFYRQGQSVARVEVRRGRLVAHVHAKYVLPAEMAEGGQQYVRLQGDALTLKGASVGAYGQRMSAEAWADTAQGYAGAEKKAIDAVLDATDNVIDLEMGQPGTGLRMDMVSIESQGPDLWVAFWEAKLANDARVRRKGDVLPEVCKQLDDYAAFVAAPENVERIDYAYRNAASVLIALRALADGLGERQPLGSEIIRAAEATELRVQPRARLLIFEPDERAWPTHEKKLRTAGIDLHVAQKGERLEWASNP
ncbi:MAG: hypothetical protein DWQ53_09750 [Microcystis flos-aquae DF17]|nr:MAG: hypothetical protein DWQ53_09750 [Microcystis flos-aquae DF17]